MIINTNRHISDYADTITFNKIGTVFENDKNVNNVQEIISKFNDFSINGNGNATTTKNGLVKIGFDGDTDVVTTKNFIEKNTKIVATNKNLGVVIFGNMKDIDKSGESVAITPKDYKDYLYSREYSKDSNGIVKFATKTEVDSRKGHSLITPKDLTYALETMVPKENVATEKEFGLVKLVSFVDLYGKGKSYDDGYAISPKTLSLSISSTTRTGLSKYAVNWDDNTNNIISPKSLMSFKGKIAEGETTVNNMNNSVQENKRIFENDAERIAKEIIAKRKESLINGIMGVGDISITSTLNETTRLKTLNGQLMYRHTYPELFSIIGYTYGGSGDYFNLPDARGMIMKMYGRGGLINGPLGNIKSYNVGDFIPQGVAPHKHAGFGFRVFRAGNWQTGTSNQQYMLPEKYRGPKGLWGSGRTAMAWYHGSRTLIARSSVLRYGDTGAQHGNVWYTNEDTRPWNISFNFMMRVL